MRCTSPRTVGFYRDGKTICWSPKKYSKEYPTFQLPCGKCISCRLERARETAVRCVHEAQMHEENCFITLTYDDANLKSSRLQYRDFQLFIKRLRRCLNQKIGVFVTGEYGDKNKRPHWHAIIFNWRPRDLEPKYTNETGDQVFSSATLEKLWPHGICELGSVTFKSAGYVARYASKKLAHGKDGTHDYDPVSRRSCKNAIGKTWLEKYWFTDCFQNGYIVLEGNIRTSIPRYYEKWLQKNHPESWVTYVTGKKLEIQKEAARKEALITLEYKKASLARQQRHSNWRKIKTRNEARNEILEQKFNQLLQRNLKL